MSTGDGSGSYPARTIELPAADWFGTAEVIIVGSGAAGMAAAIRSLVSGRRVTMITKGTLGDGSTAWAQGGLAAVTARDDTLAAHLEDTLVAGAGLCDSDVVRSLVVAAPAAIGRLLAAGARFDRAADGSLALGLEGGHRARRIVHTGDSSGAEVARVLAARVRRAVEDGRMQLHEHTMAVDALTDRGGSVCGLRVIDGAGLVGEIGAAAVVLASGGIGQAWQTTTNPPTATGDGLALAARAGAVLRDSEFVQFHPTVLALPADRTRPGDRGVLISEAVRGEGARLIDVQGRMIMAGLHPLADLAPRDVVSAAMHAELVRSGAEHLYLDGTGLGIDVWRHHFPVILAMCRERGVDPVTEPIPVRPAQHYACGGVLADLDGVTSVPGLFAVGEVAATGVQGANRLASNSLTEALIAGDRLGALLATSTQVTPDRLAAVEPVRTIASIPGGQQSSTPGARPRIQAAMSRWCGVLRDEAGLSALSSELDTVGLPAPARAQSDVQSVNLLTVARAIGTAALLRTESRGCHRRADHPESRVEWQHHLDLRLHDGARFVAVMTQEVAA